MRKTEVLPQLITFAEIGINEYWIVDYLGIGGYRYIGNPKQPTISIYQLIDGEYQVQYFRNNEPIQSPSFSDLTLTVNQIFQGNL